MLNNTHFFKVIDWGWEGNMRPLNTCTWEHDLGLYRAIMNSQFSLGDQNLPIMDSRGWKTLGGHFSYLPSHPPPFMLQRRKLRLRKTWPAYSHTMRWNQIKAWVVPLLYLIQHMFTWHLLHPWWETKMNKPENPLSRNPGSIRGNKHVSRRCWHK